VDQQRLTATVSGDQITISRGTSEVLGIDMESRSVGHWPDGETWEVLAVLPAKLSSDKEESPAEDDETVLCGFCQRQCSARTAHLYQGGWVGDECCWDERLRSSD